MAFFHGIFFTFFRYFFIVCNFLDFFYLLGFFYTLEFSDFFDFFLFFWIFFILFKITKVTNKRYGGYY